MSNLDEEIVNEYNGWLNKQLRKGLSNIFCNQLANLAGIYLSENTFENIKLGIDTVNDIKSIPSKVQGFSENVVAAVDGVLYVLQNEFKGRSMYFNSYLSNRPNYSSPDDYVFAPAGANGPDSKEGILQSMYPGAHATGVDQIKVRHLLTHTSGWQYATTGGVDPIFTGDSRFYGKTLKQRVEYMVNTAVSNTPGSVYSYYNLGFCVLGQIVEKLTGGTYEAYLRQVEAKAGVTDVWIAKNSRAERRANEACYYAQQSTDAYQNDMAVVAACGAVIASPVDLMQVVCAEDYGTVVPDILKKETLDMMYTNYTSSGKGGYGFGWRIGHNTLTNWASYHGGNINGTGTIIVRGNNGVNGVLLCNSRSYIDDFDTALYVGLDAIMSLVKANY